VSYGWYTLNLNFKLVKGLEGGPVRQGGPHQVGIHLAELGHVLNQAKVVQIRTLKSVFNCSDRDQNKHKVNYMLVTVYMYLPSCTCFKSSQSSLTNY
jgi:hypothetical protein